MRGWNNYWQLTDYQEEKLVETLIRNEWMHKRAQRWYLAAKAGEKTGSTMVKMFCEGEVF